MDKLLNSNEQFPGQHYRSKKRSTNTYDDRTLNQNDSLSGSYSCQMFSSTNSVAVVEVQSSIPTLRVIRDFDNGFSGNLGEKKNKITVMSSTVKSPCLVIWYREKEKVKTLDDFIVNSSLQDGHEDVDSQCGQNIYIYIYLYFRSDLRFRNQSLKWKSCKSLEIMDRRSSYPSRSNVSVDHFDS